MTYLSTGRLAQVDAAFEAANKGSTVVGLRGNESVVVITHSPSLSSKNIMKTGGAPRTMARRMQPRRVMQLCHTISYTASGKFAVDDTDFLLSRNSTYSADQLTYLLHHKLSNHNVGIAADSQYLVNKMFEKTSDHLYAYGTDPSIYRLAKEAADICHMRTLANNRPLGVKAIFIGTDKANNPTLLEVDPVGNIHDCKLSCLGLLSEKIVEAFHDISKNDDSYIDGLDTPNLIRFGLKCLHKALNGNGDKLDLDSSEITVVTHDCTAPSTAFASSLLYISRDILQGAIEKDDFSGFTLRR